MILWTVPVCTSSSRMASLMCSGASFGKVRWLRSLSAWSPTLQAASSDFLTCCRVVPSSKHKCFSNVCVLHICLCTTDWSNVDNWIQGLELQTLLFNGRNSKATFLGASRQRWEELVAILQTCNTHITKYIQRSLSFSLILLFVPSFSYK